MNDHTLFGAAIARGLIKWEPFENYPRRGEICFQGLRYSTDLDNEGVPMLSSRLRNTIEYLLKCADEIETT